MQIFDSFKNLQKNYQKNITASVKNNNHLRSIFKENIEKFSLMNKRLDRLNRLFEENKLKKNFDEIKEQDRKYAESTVLINNLEKQLFGNMLKNVINENEDEVRKNEKMKNALLICLKNSLRKLDKNNNNNNNDYYNYDNNNYNYYDDIDDDVKNGIEYLKGKYNNLLKNENEENQENEEKIVKEKIARLQKVIGK